MGTDGHHVLLDETRRQRDEFAVGAVDEEQILAEIGPLTAAERADAARRRIGGHHAIAFPEPVDAAPDGRDRARELMAEYGGHVRDHHRMARRSVLTSVPQVSAASTRTTSSPALGSGVATSSNRRSP